MKKYILIALLATISFVVKAQDQMDVSKLPDWTPTAHESFPLENRFKAGMHYVQGVGRIFYAPIVKDAMGRFVIQDMTKVSVAVMRQIGKDQYVKEKLIVPANFESQEQYIKFFLGNIEPNGTLTITRNGQWVKGNNGIQLFRYCDTQGNPDPLTIPVKMGRQYLGKGYNSNENPWSDIMYIAQI
ncbi:MAG: hypothetical protein V4478_02785 [Patescibacteria group bacterium]